MGKEEKNYSKLAIISFIISIISLILTFFSIIGLFGLTEYNFSYYFSPILYFLAPLTLILSIISIVIIHKKNLKGKFYAYFSLIAAIIMIIIPVIFWLFIIIYFFRQYASTTTGSCESRPTEVLNFDEWTYPRAECYYGLVVQSNNYSKCEDYKNVTDFSNDRCYENFEQETGDWRPCEYISNSSYLYGDCFEESAAKNNDSSICDKMISPQGCYSSFAFDTKNLSFCGYLKFKFDGNYSDECYKYYSLLSHNYTICGMIDNASIRDDCYFNPIEYQNNTEDCDKIKDINLSADCYTKVANTQKDSSICEKIKQRTGPNSIDSCYISFIYNKYNKDYDSIVNICEKVSNLSDVHYSRDACYFKVTTGVNEYEISTGTMDLRLCEKINNNALKDECVNDVNKEIQIKKDF